MDKMEIENGENGYREQFLNCDGGCHASEMGGGGPMQRKIGNEPAKVVWLKLHKLDLLMEDSDHFKNECCLCDIIIIAKGRGGDGGVAVASVACYAILQLLS